MSGFPKTTEFHTRIPKQKFYEKLNIAPAVKKVFVEQIKTIYWRNKLAAATCNLEKGTAVEEIEVFEVKLSSPQLDESVLRLIDRVIPYHILFLLECEGKYQAAIGYKEKDASGKAAFKVDRYYYTDWMEEEKLPIRMDGLSTDAVYENFVRQIAGADLAASADSDTALKDSIAQQKQREQLQKQITALETKIRNEKQPKKKFELVQQARKLEQKLDLMRN